MNTVKLLKLEKYMRSNIQHYNAEKYWRYRQDVIENGGVFQKDDL